MDNENGNSDASNQDTVEETNAEDTETTPKTFSEEEVAEIKKKAELADNYKTRAEKAEKKLKDSSKETKKEDDFVLSRSDERALIKADIEEEDENEVLDYARLKKISVSDALKTSLVKGLIAEKKQERATALATQTKGGNKGQVKVTGETILAQAKQGQMPDENDVDGIAKLAEAEWEAKNKKR